MANWALVAHANRDIVAVIASVVTNEMHGIECVQCETLDAAESVLRDRGESSCKLIVAGVRVPWSASDAFAVDSTDLPTLDFVRKIRERGNTSLRVVLLVSFNDGSRDFDVAQLSNLQVVQIQVDIVRDLKRAIPREQPRPHYLDVDIRLHQEPPYHWRLQRKSPPLEESGPLDLRASDLAVLKLHAESWDGCPKSQALDGFGQLLYCKVMGASTDRKGTRLAELMERHGGIKSSRIRFNVDHFTHPILLEAVSEPRDDGHEPAFWMLQAPMFRKYERTGRRHPLFKDARSRSEPVDCLLIQGCLDELYAGAPVDGIFKSIPKVRDEVDWLEQYLKTNRDRFRIGMVNVLRYGEHPGIAFSDEIKETLAAHEWRMVHYAGHSAKAKKGDGGYLVTGPEDPDLVNAKDFANWASAAQFVFLSSCESADSYFVMHLVEQFVPALVGYRWPIGDSAARMFAQGFYTELFEGPERTRYLEHAFLQGKRDLQTHAQGSCSWAAPLLIMQMLHPESDEIK